jgi:hypothetical protein
MEQSVHRPLSQSGLPIVRRVNSAIRERVGLDLRERRPRRPVVTDSSIDPSTRCHPKIIALRARAAAARAVGRGPTPSPPALLPASGSRFWTSKSSRLPAVSASVSKYQDNIYVFPCPKIRLSCATRARKGSMEQSVHRPLSQSGLPIVRRVNSAIRERVGLDLRERRPRRPVVTDCSIDPSTRPIPNRPRCRGGAHGRAWRKRFSLPSSCPCSCQSSTRN